MNRQFEIAPPCNSCSDSLKTLPFNPGTYHLNLLPPLQVVRCLKCNLLFMNPRPSQECMSQIFSGQVPDNLFPYGSKPVNYGEVTEQRRSLFFNRLNEIDHGNNNIKRKFLDIGASSGTMVQLANEAGWDAYGIEPSTAGVNECKTKGLNVMQALAEKLPFPDNHFDFVHSHHVFEHLSNPFKASEEVFRVLKPGGKFFMEVPNQFDNIHFFRYRFFGTIPVRNRDIRSIHHFYFFSKRNFKLLFKDAGFIHVKVKDYYLASRKGIGWVGSFISHLIGKFFLGGYIIQAIGQKPDK